MKRQDWFIIFTVLIIGVIFRLFITWNNNFLFNMDTARDMVDVRQMVLLKNITLIGSNSSVDGVFNGAWWYYLLSVPFIISNGNPYAPVVLEILLWVIGGIYLMYLLRESYGKAAMVIGGSLWVSSNYVILATQYSFNPNPTLLLTPIFIFVLVRFLNSNALFYSIAMWFLAGLFLNFEILGGLVFPFIILFSVLFGGKSSYLKKKNFYIGILFFVLAISPSLLFELRHNFLMTHSLLNFVSSRRGVPNQGAHIKGMVTTFFDTLLALFMNIKLLVYLFIGVVFYGLYQVRTLEKKDSVLLVSLLSVLTPLILFLFVPIDVMRWHFNASMGAAFFLISFLICGLFKKQGFLKLLGIILVIGVLGLGMLNLKNYALESRVPNSDPSLLSNQLAPIDYAYRFSNGENFKVYWYLPSVIDYPAQYLFWWYGQKKYGYLPIDYAYAPNKPMYIKNKEKFSNGKNLVDSGIVYLIEEQSDQRLFDLWKNNFVNFKKIDSVMIGPYVIETRKINEKTN